MKTALPRNETEIVATIVSLADKISSMETELINCQNEISSHAIEARQSNKDIHDKIALLQFSVTSMEKTIGDMQAILKQLTEFFKALTTIGNFTVKLLKAIVVSTTLIATIMCILKYLGKM